MDINWVQGVVVAVVGIMGKVGWDKVITKILTKKSTNDILLDLFIESQKNQQMFFQEVREDSKKMLETFNSNNIKLAESFDKLSNLIQKSNEKIIVKNQEDCDILVKKFSFELKSKFINEVSTIYMLNGLCQESTTQTLRTVFSDLITDFYNEIQRIDGIKEYIHKKEYVLSIINISKFDQIIFNLLIEHKSINDMSKLKRDLSNKFDIMFNICFNAEKHL